MNEESWVRTGLDDLKAFLGRFEGVMKPFSGILADDGQRNLFWNTAKSSLMTSRHKLGDEVTPLEFGRLFGHWEIHFRIMIKAGAAERNAITINQIVVPRLREMRSQLERFPQIAERCPMIVFLIDCMQRQAAMFDPKAIAEAGECLPEFHALCDRIRRLAESQETSGREAFHRGYGEAIASNSVGPDGMAVVRDYKSEFITSLRPFVKEANMTAVDFHELLSLLLGQDSAGDAESFSRFLRRNSAAVCDKGRPTKKETTQLEMTSKKSDKN